MADPFTIGMGVVSLATAAGGAVMSAKAAKQQGAAGYQSGMYQAMVAAQNAKIAMQNANYAVGEGEQIATKYGLGAAAQMGQIKAAQGASGLDVNSGSAKQVQESQQTVTKMDMDTIRNNAAKTAYNYELQATQALSQSKLDVAGAQNKLAAGNIAAEASLVSGAGSVADKWLAGQQTGLWGKLGSSLPAFGA